MTTLNSLHIDIAKVLMQCAKENKTITYGELCKEVGYNSPRTMGAVLDPLTKLAFTYNMVCLFPFWLYEEKLRPMNCLCQVTVSLRCIMSLLRQVLFQMKRLCKLREN